MPIGALMARVSALWASWWKREPLVPVADVPVVDYPPPPSAALLPPPDPPPPPQPQPQPSSARVPRNRDISEFYFREAILDQADKYFLVLKQMKKHDRDAFDLYSQAGGHLIPDSLLNNVLASAAEIRVSPWFASTMPSFGCVCLVMDRFRDTDEKLHPRFMYFRKYDTRSRPIEVQPVNTDGALYVLTCFWWDYTTNPKHCAPTEFPVLVRPDGTLRGLKSASLGKVSIRVKRGKRRGKFIEIPRFTKWSFNEFNREWAAEHNATPDMHMAALFAKCSHFFEASNMSMTRVGIRKGDMEAIFGVNIHRTAYFFKDRGEVTQGSKKRIFHIVRPHERQTKTGHTFVRMHFRGERQFVWNGYDVTITVPGLHHNSVAEFAAGAIDELDMVEGTKYAGSREVGKVIRNHINGIDQ